MVGTVVSLADLVLALGGRYSIEMGIDVDRDDEEVERWFLAATLFGHPISARTVVRTHAALGRAGILVIADVAGSSWEALVESLDEGGYVRYDFSTATRLQALAKAVDDRFGGRIAGLGRLIGDPAELEATLDALPGWGPTTVRVFLRELRGRWPAARPPIDVRACSAARHLGLPVRSDAKDPRSLAGLEAMAAEVGLDVRDAEAALIRLELAHVRRGGACPGGTACLALRR
jgi:endonuclease III